MIDATTTLTCSVIEILTLSKDAVVALAAAVTGTVAVVGLSNWNRELRGKASFEVARSLARATYKLRDELRHSRSPLLSASEFPEGYVGHLGQNSSRERADALAYVYGNRWKHVYEALESFDTNTLEAEAMWGEKYARKLTCFGDVSMSYEVLSKPLLTTPPKTARASSQTKNSARI